jgi:hypothetical protein
LSFLLIKEKTVGHLISGKPAKNDTKHPHDHHARNKLARYAPDDVGTNAKRRERFLDGLNDKLAVQLSVVYAPNYQSLIDKATILESKHSQMETRKRKHNKGTHSHHYKQGSSSRLSVGVIIITLPRASDSDFTEERAPRKTPLHQPHEACISLCQIDGSSHRRLTTPILTMSSEEEIYMQDSHRRRPS